LIVSHPLLYLSVKEKTQENQTKLTT